MDYFNREVRQKKLEVIQVLLHGRNIQTTAKQISEKLANLKLLWGAKKTDREF